MQSFLSCLQAARVMGVSSSTVKRLCDDESLEVVRTPGGHRRIPAQAIEAWLAENGMQSVAMPGSKRKYVRLLAHDEMVDALAAGNVDLVEFDLSERLCRGEMFPEIVDDVLMPVMTEVGSLWERGEWDVYQEHFATKTLADVLARIRQSDFSKWRDQPRIAASMAICCTLDEEQHGLITDMIELSLVQMGWQCVNLGVGIPQASLVSAVKEFDPRLICVSYSFVADVEQCYTSNRCLFNEMHENQRLMIGGRGLVNCDLSQMKYHQLGSSLSDIANFARELAGQRKPSATFDQ
ncbi:MAG: B12-binding domain-containing protein [Pirellulaceae bacterium]